MHNYSFPRTISRTVFLFSFSFPKGLQQNLEWRV
jgi:hypothetical protein